MGNFHSKLSNCQMIPRPLIFDTSLSDRARFIYVYMAAKPEGWNFYISTMSKELGYSEETLRKYVKELISEGWLEKGEQIKSDKNEFGSSSYTLLDTKTPLISPCRKNAVPEECRAGRNTTLYNRDNEYNIIENIREDKENKKNILSKVPKSSHDDDIVALYKLYPSKCPFRKVALKSAESNKRQIMKIIKSGKPISNIEASIKKYVAECMESKTYFKQFATFLNNMPDYDDKSNGSEALKFKTSDPLHKELKIIDNEGTLSDGTFIKHGKRWYFSEGEGKAISIPTFANPKPIADKGWHMEFIYDVMVVNCGTWQEESNE